MLRKWIKKTIKDKAFVSFKHWWTYSLWWSTKLFANGGLECVVILRGRWGSALEGLTGMWLSNPIPSAEVTGVGWCNQELGEFYLRKKGRLQLLGKAKNNVTVGLK